MCRPSADVYTYKHFYTDALAVLDHLNIAKAHFVGLSMGSYSSLQIGLNAPERALSMTLAARRRGLCDRKSRRVPRAMPGQCRAVRDDRLGRGRQGHARGAEPDSVPAEGSRAATRISTPHSPATDAKGSANTMRSFQGGRPSIYTMTDAIRKVPTPALIICGDEDDNCIEPSMFLKKHLPAAGLAFFPKAGHVLNLEEPALFNDMVERFVTLVEAGRWPVRDPQVADARAGANRHFPLPPRLSKNTPCSPNMFQTHQGRFSGTGRP